MTVLQIFNRYREFGGEENSANRMARQLELNGIEVKRFWVDPLPVMSNLGTCKAALRMFWNRSVLAELERCSRECQPDVWLMHNLRPVISYGVYHLGAKLRVPMLQWLHNFKPISPSGTLMANGEVLQPGGGSVVFRECLAGSWRGSRLQTSMAAAVDIGHRWKGSFDHVNRWVAVSEYMSGLFRQGNWYPDRLRWLHHCWEISMPVPSLPVLKGRLPYFVFVGRLVPEKGIEFLVGLFEDEALANVELWVLGEGELKAELEQRGINNVRFIGYVAGEEKKSIIASSLGVLFPSIWEEPLSTIAYEAYEQSVPFVTSRVGGMPEVVNHGETGWVLERGDRTQWVEVIRLLVSNRELVVSTGSKGRAWLEANVSGSVWSDRFKELVEEARVDRDSRVINV
ncbi:MAG: glycosyltransferase family 4 protein [Verrucomicrobiae bacterium]|nr:glycosyltransferase family 4 protein [Verrucomicrobiae bacterium]